MAKRSWAKGREKGVKSVRLDLDVHEIAMTSAENEKMTLKDYIAQCVINAPNTHKPDTSTETDCEALFRKVADRLIKEKSSFWESLSKK